MSLLTSKQCWLKYGDPEQKKHLILWDVPDNLQIAALPDRVYCNKDLVEPLKQAFGNIIERGLIDQVKSWDGCFNIRPKKAGKTLSLHSWAVAVDINAATNGFRKKPTMSPELVKCFTDAGFDWGGIWSIPDGMHFQLRG